MSNREILCELGLENSTVFENPDYDSAIVGYTEAGNVVYDYDLMVESLANEEGMTELDSMEFIGYNTIRSLPYAPDPKPVILHRLEFLRENGEE